MDFVGAYSGANLSFLFESLLETLKMAGLAIILSLIFGIILGVLRFARIPVITQIVAIIVDILRNLPLVLIIMVSYFGLRDFGIQLDVFSAAILALTIFEAAMISEIVRSGLNSIPKGQMEAARSSGLSYTQALRHIILPQGLRRMVPPTVSQCIALLKDTSLTIAIGATELMYAARVVYASQTSYMVPTLILVALIYFVINYSLSILSRRLEAKQI
ncbi:aspartate/glutamate/glutamine transport system permease protein [Cytobacillus horneckiae]|uniref:amino acid ABC transporter permease n=1 Tax=Cytobacillus horneckiae TaxID=549687 RepID=UPI0019CF75B4|nr:amino acid ABC transporter permease [Cytobacillus horneckiae]MBN6886397.1 amino acid ABC transporter permease [Cytobacillus horneckiae]MCM3176641.1 amino acid ABC transporter permease [Cytobacillus horneckiae]